MADIADIDDAKFTNGAPRSQHPGDERRNLARRVPGVWTTAQREPAVAQPNASAGELLISDRRKSPSRGKDRRNLATRTPGTWTEEERQRFLAAQRRAAAEMANDDPRRI